MSEKEVIQKLEAGDKNFEICNLSGLDLGGLNFKGANLCGANLHHSDLCDADLRGANLRGANLCDADLYHANLCDANIDYACWPLWCGSLGVKMDVRIARQLAYHLCALSLIHI